MISHALTIVVNELNTHLTDAYASENPTVVLGNIAEGVNTGIAGSVLRDKINLSIVNIKEEKTLKNLPHYVRNDATLTTRYENPPVFLNFQILITATHTDYIGALTMLSRVIRFFQFKNVFTQDNVAPLSITTSLVNLANPAGSPPMNPLDQLSAFKLIFDLYSPTMEEVNHLWGTLGGKQYPFVIYTLRMLDLQFKAVQSESGVITEIVSDFYHKNTAVLS